MPPALSLPAILHPTLAATVISFIGVFTALSLLWCHRKAAIADAYLSLGVSLVALSTVPALHAHIPLAAAGILAILKGCVGLGTSHEPCKRTNIGASVIAILLLFLIGTLLFLDLDSYSYKPLVWEAVVMKNLMLEIARDAQFGARLYGRLLWSEGLLSEGDRSLLYGLITSEILPRMPSMFGVRIASVVLTLGSVVTLFIMMRRLFNPTIAAISIGIFGLNELTLIYGRYGSSLAGSFFGIITAWWACTHAARAPSVRTAVWASFALYIATLGYAPARLMVMVLIPLTMIGVLGANRAPYKNRLSALLLLITSLVLAVWWQRAHYRLDMFTSARLEHIPGMFITGYWPDFLLPAWEEIQRSSGLFAWSHYIAFSKQIISHLTLPNLITVLSPFSPENRGAVPFDEDPLFLKIYAPILLPFIVVGMTTMRRFNHRWLNATLWTSSLWTIAILLLTNRIDSYRAAFLLLPITIWASVGLFQFSELIKKTWAGKAIVSFACVGLVYMFAAPRFIDLTRPNTTRLITKTVALPLLAYIPGNPIIGVEPTDFRVLAELSLDTLRRKKMGENFAKRFLSDQELNTLAGQHPSAVSVVETQIQRGSPLIIAPANRFWGLALELSRRGYAVRIFPTPTFRIFIISKADTASGITVGALYSSEELSLLFHGAR
jgi:hypothetical protein